MGARQKKKRNHFVPQAYLRTFAADTGRAKIWTLRKTGEEAELKPISNVAMRFYLYTPKTSARRDYAFEDRLSDLEQLFGSQIWRALGSDFIDLNWPALRKGVSLLAAVMFLRNPLRWEHLQDFHKQMVGAISAMPSPPASFLMGGKEYELDFSDWAAFCDATEDDIKRMWLGQISSATWLAEIFLQMRWAVAFSETPSFITTDNPVVPLHESNDFRGFYNKDTSVVFPLSPTRILFMDWQHGEPDGQYYPVRSTAPLNLLLWRDAKDVMLAPRHPDEICAELVRYAETLGAV